MRLRRDKSNVGGGSFLLEPGNNFLVFSFFLKEKWLRCYGDFPLLRRPIIIFRVLTVFCNCLEWSTFSMFASHCLVAVATGVSPHRVVKMESRDEQSHGGAQLLL